MQLTRICTIDPPKEETNLYSDFKFYKGTTFRKSHTFYNEDGTPLPIGTNVINFKAINGNDEIILSLSSNGLTTNGSTVLILDAPNGEIEILVTDEETSLLDLGTLRWWMTMNMVNGDVIHKGRGIIYILNPY